MEDAKSSDKDDHFWDAYDEFSFYDCPEDFGSSNDSSSSPQSVLSVSSSTVSNPCRSQVSGGLRRRRLLPLAERDQKFYQHLNELDRGAGNLNSDTVESTTSRSVSGGVNVEKNERSTVTTAVENGDDPPSVSENDEGQFSLLVFLAELLIKAIGLQVNLLISFISFPFWALYYSFMLAVNPLYVLRLGRNYFIGKLMRIWKFVSDAVSPFLSEWIKEHKSLLKFALRFGWGVFWSVLVGSILVSLLIMGFVISGLIVKYYIIEEPFQLTQTLNFDYTKSKPVAFVPIKACPTMISSENNEFRRGQGVRVLPPGYKLQTTVTMALPESNYNRNLGIFQIRVDFLSENGKSLASVSRPCMLAFRSEPIRMLVTFFKIIPLVAGYVSESQTIRLKFGGYTEAITPTTCLRVTIEQRAEFKAGAGIPEIYNAFIDVESDLPFFKWIFWHWRRTIFVWLSMILFLVELLFTLVCYGAVMIPRARTSSATGSSDSQRIHHTQT